MSMDRDYTTITGEIPEGGVSPVSYEIQRSLFLAYVIHAEDEDEVRTWLAALKKEHYDARHAPYSMVLGADAARQRSSDDGEPGGTAGSPILEAIKGRGITDIAVAVVRYFGGIKLGAGGLIRAYAHAAGLGLDAAPKLRMTLLRELSVTIDYDLLAAVERYIRTEELIAGETTYAERVTCLLRVPPDDIARRTAELTDLTAGRAVCTCGVTAYQGIPCE